MRKTWFTIAVLGLAAAANVQGAGLPGFAMVGRSQRLSVFAREGKTVDVSGLDKRLAAFEKQLGQTVAHAEYYQYDYPEELAVATGQFAGGLTKGHEVHSTREASNHELVHLVGQELGQPGAFFQEGLAVALGDQGKYRGAPVQRTAARLHRGMSLTRIIAQFDARQPGDDYAVAGSFVAWLVKQHGVEKLTSFFRATRRNTPDAAFALTFGRTLDEEGALWSASL